MKKGKGEDINVLLSSTDSIPGFSIRRSLGFVTGSASGTVHANSALYSFLASLIHPERRTEPYDRLFRSIRHRALLRLMENARKLGANAVVGVRISFYRVGYGFYEAFAYGTAVEVIKNEEEP